MEQCAKTKDECSSMMLATKDALELLGGKWTIPIIVALHHGNYRYRELSRQVQGITTKMLSKELKQMEMNRLVKREVFDTIPVSVEYSLTKHGESLLPVIDELYKWGKQHRKFIHAALRSN